MPTLELIRPDTRRAAETRLRTVLVLNDFCHVQGGASKVAVDGAIALRRAGVDVTFLGAAGPVGPELRAAGLRTICLDQPELAAVSAHPGVTLQGLWNRGAYRRTEALLKTCDPRHTIIHVHGYTKALSASPMRAAHRAGFAVICTLHDFFAACPNGAFFDYQRQAPCGLRALSPACMLTRCDKRHAAHKAWRVLRGLAQRHVARFPDSAGDFICLSDRSATLLRPYLPAQARLHRLENPVDMPCAPPAGVERNASLVVVGRLEAEKGVQLAAEAARRAAMPITFVGDGPLRRQVEACGAEVTGWVGPEAVRAHLDQARCLIFPSLWYETYGLVVAEAAARGVPAIVSDVSAAAERVVDGVTGWHVRAGDPDALLRCLDVVRDDAAVAAAGRAAWHRFWADPPDLERHARDLRHLYEDVLQRRAA